MQRSLRQYWITHIHTSRRFEKSYPKEKPTKIRWWLHMLLMKHLASKKLEKRYPPKEKSIIRRVASYALYETLSRHNVPRTASEIQYFTGCDTSLLFKIESSLHLTETLNKPQDFVSRFCSILNLRFRDERRIKSIVENMFGMASIRPHCIVAVAIFLYCKEKNIDCPLKRICETCDVTSTNIYSVIRKMKTLYVNKITLLCSPNVISI